ncbi:MAG: hypothetical protein ACFB4I_14905 [Cyanophyceae cyanobacterium]
MYAINNPEKFDLCVTLIIGALKLQNQEIVKRCEETLIALMGSAYTTNVMTVAAIQLSETDPDICRWALKALSQLQSYHQLLKDLVFLASYTLIKQGFVPGKDFSITPTNTMLIKPEAQAALFEAIAPEDGLLMEAVLLTSY